MIFKEGDPVRWLRIAPDLTRYMAFGVVKSIESGNWIKVVEDSTGAVDGLLPEFLHHIDTNDVSYRCRKRAEIRRQIKTRKSVQEGAPDRIADLFEEAANEIDRLRQQIAKLTW